MVVPIVCVVGWHNSGKTTFVVGLVAELKRRGLRVATVKHARGGFDMDHEGTDTWRYMHVGSDVVAIASGEAFALHERTGRELSLDEIIARLTAPVDLVIAEGFKRSPTRKIEVLQAGGVGEGRIAKREELLALIVDGERLPGESAPQFDISDARGVADLLAREGILKQP